MRSLTAQFDHEMEKAFELHAQRANEISDELRKTRRQQVILNTLISDYRHKDELIEHVLMRLGQEAFQPGDDAVLFFCKCADELFLKNLAKIPDHEHDQYKRMKALHPLWGESWWTK